MSENSEPRSEDLKLTPEQSVEAQHVSDGEKYLAIVSLLSELPTLLETDEYGFSRKGHVWEDSVRKGLIKCAKALEKRNE